MKQYEVTLTGHYEKTISVYADSPEQAAEKLHLETQRWAVRTWLEQAGR